MGKVDPEFRKCAVLHCRPVVHKMCPLNPNGSTIGSYGIRGYIAVIVTLKFNVCLKLIAELL